MAEKKLPDHLKNAFDELDKLKTPKWAYTILTKEKKRETEVRFDPSLEGSQRYALLAVNGQAPSEEELQKYRERKEKAKKSDDGFSIRNMPEMASIIHHSTLKPLDEDDAVIKYQFKPKLDIPIIKNVIHKLDGEMHFCKQDEIVKRIKIVNSKTFTPIPSFKIEKLFGEAVFDLVADGQVQLVGTEMRLKGKKFFVSALEQEAIAVYSDYVQVIFD